MAFSEKHVEKFGVKKNSSNCGKRRRILMRFEKKIASYFIASVQPTTKFWKCQSINVEHKMHLFMMVAVPNGAKTLASAVKNLVIGKYHLHTSGLLNKLVLDWQLFLNYIYYLGGKVFYLVFKIKCKSLLDPPFISDMIEIRFFSIYPCKTF